MKSEKGREDKKISGNRSRFHKEVLGCAWGSQAGMSVEAESRVAAASLCPCRLILWFVLRAFGALSERVIYEGWRSRLRFVREMGERVGGRPRFSVRRDEPNNE